ncbi:glycosyltransferase family 2 protein [Ancylomarina euxinus]|uniref:Glycosyltransferase family 2 protein n=1 Tax=Ancylomarina euxinus TaxID=2283627 RepID=A0A425Y255_9BACT|nr:glycosyltransferase family 2 protein [Ancylomarina euxinus]MCZ4695113.1 glycosyltransferase family 2 protein [Ancylomarina euxinus]MUP14951.1 glycosyltransferase [Ancylomarina euxinus]RRG21843.1 glycosyltransferase family 2 protein [Ancylomarina euxinus]
MKNTVKLSGVVITLNEEENIGRCIESLQKVTDDIVIVDSFSTDKTEEICHNYGVRFLKHKYEGGIAQVGWAVKQAKYDHILLLDADEELSKELEESINEVKSNWTHGGYSLRFRTLFCGKWLVHSWRHRVLRLFDRTEVDVAGREPHYNFAPQKGIKVVKLKGDVKHHAYYQIDEFIAKRNTYSTRSAVASYQQGKKAPLYKLLINPFWNFFRNYILLAGFLDGIHGLTVCTLNSQYIFMKYAKLRNFYFLDKQKQD